MLKAQRAAFVTLAAALDVTALVLAFLTVCALRSSLGDFLEWIGGSLGYSMENLVRRPSQTYRILLSRNPLVNIQNHLWVLYLSIPAWLFFLHVQRAYDPQAQRNARQEFAICAYAGMVGTVSLMVFMFLFKQDVSRLLIVGFLMTGVSFLWLGRTVVLPLAQRRGRQPIRNLLVIGNHAAAHRFAEILQSPAYRWSRLVGYVSDANSDVNGDANEETVESAGAQILPRLGTLADLERILDRDVIDEVVLVRSQADSFTQEQPAEVSRKWANILELCLQRGRTVSLVDDMVPPVGAKVEATMMGTMPTLVLHNTPQGSLSLVLKNIIDRAIALIALIALAPLFAAIALAIKLTSPGPVLFKQKRVGLNGRLFSFYKFRSMVVNAEEILEKHRDEWEKHNKMSGGFFKWEEDPRVTKVGRFLRKYSLDELPQFWNVLRGDMSLVGPRPPLPKEVEQLQPWQRRKLSVKGGLTCLWQVSGRNEIDTDEWMRLDLEYIDNWSLWLDLKLILKTLKVLVKPKGAS